MAMTRTTMNSLCFVSPEVVNVPFPSKADSTNYEVNIGLDVGRCGERKGSNSGSASRRPMKDEGDPPKSPKKTGAETACGRDYSLRLGGSGRGAVRDVTSAGVYFTTRDLCSTSEEAAFS